MAESSFLGLQCLLLDEKFPVFHLCNNFSCTRDFPYFQCCLTQKLFYPALTILGKTAFEALSPYF